MAARFPDIDWYCDCCSAYLSDQDGFDDHKYIWQCKECGRKIVYLPQILLKLIYKIAFSYSAIFSRVFLFLQAIKLCYFPENMVK